METVMRHILVMESDLEILAYYQELLHNAGYRVTTVSDQDKAMKLLSPLPLFPPDRFDFIISAGLHWKPCYELAAVQYGLRNLVVVTGSSEIVKHVDFLGTKAFEKPVPLKEVIDYIYRSCPPE
jgi:CheY-like chemotaxis protein